MCYMAVLHGIPEQPSGTLINYLVKDSTTNTVSVTESPEEGKKASLDYIVRGLKDGMSLVDIKLHTGRSHQIRVQFTAIGHPLYGDQRYGASQNKPGMQLALWSAEIGFAHPTLKHYVSFRSSPPAVYPWNLFCKGE